MPIYNNLFQFSPRCHIEERITSERTPFFVENGPFSWQKTPNFSGSGGYFGLRRLNRLPRIIGMCYLIYRDDFNVKGLDLHALWLSSYNFLIDLPLMKGRLFTGFLRMFTGVVFFSVKCFLAL
jgi:hypothetical protein